MADMGFLPAVRRILGQTNKDRQVLLFSATLDGAVGTLAAAVQRHPVRHEVGPQGPTSPPPATSSGRSTAPSGRGHGRRRRALGSTMVFCRTRHGADRLAKQLGQLGVTAAPIHGGRSQPQRDRALKAFATGDVRSLSPPTSPPAACTSTTSPPSCTSTRRRTRRPTSTAPDAPLARARPASSCRSSSGPIKRRAGIQREVGIDVAVTRIRRLRR